MAIETCDLKGAQRRVLVSVPDESLRDFCWLPHGRIVYSRKESQGSTDHNLWQIDVDEHSGKPTDKPKRITQWAGFTIDGLSASADGRRLAFRNATYQDQVYLGELAAGGLRLSPPRRLSNAESHDLPIAWTADSKSLVLTSDRNGQWGIFKQRIGQDTAEPLVTPVRGTDLLPRLSPDGAWIIYREEGGPSAPDRLMRIPINGGVPELVLETRSWQGHNCARAPSSLCVVIETSQDGMQFVVTAFDLLKGRGKVLRSLEVGPPSDFYGGLSPDGSTLAFSTGEGQIHIQLLSLSGGADREITVNGWSGMQSLDWSADGKGLYFGSVSPQRLSLVYVDLKGNARVLWQYKGASYANYSVWGIPSPDGRYLALKGDVVNANAWMLEDISRSSQ
jgi:Tol biopolymer transport system component